MFKKLISIIVFGIVLSPVTANAEWIKVNENDKTILSIERKLIVKNNRTIFFWDRFMYKEVQVGDMKFEIAYKEVDCQEIAVKVRKSLIYNTDGEVISKEEYDPVDFDYPVPGSFSENLLKAICQLGNFKSKSEKINWITIGKTSTGETLALDVGSANFASYSESVEFTYKFVGDITTRVNKAVTGSCDTKTGKLLLQSPLSWVVTNQNGKGSAIIIKADSEASKEMLKKVCQQAFINRDPGD